MNYPDLIWRLVEMLLQKEVDQNQGIDNELEDKKVNADVHDKTV